MKLSNLFKSLSLTTVSAISSFAILMLNQNKSLADTTGHIVEYSSKKCIGVHGGRTDNLAPIVLWDCVNHPDQIWTFHDDTSTLTNKSGKCIGVYGGLTKDLTALVLTDCNGNLDQSWYFSVPSPAIVFNAKSYDKGLDQVIGADGGLSENGTALVIADYNAAPDQLWSFQP